jgi:hypothetical protein
MVKKSIQVELMDCFDEMDKTREVSTKIPSRQAFTKSRNKISYTAFKDFFDKSCELIVNDPEPKLYKGYRIYAVDGTSFVVGDLVKLSGFFGTSTTVPDKAMCRISGIVDILDDHIVNACVSPFNVGERALAIEQVEELKSLTNALFLFDRGYWSVELTAKIIGNGQRFLMRLPSNVGKSGMHDDDGVYREFRRVSFLLPSGDTQVLISNIPETEMSDDELIALYTKRWGIETKYLELKSRLQIDRFSGDSVNIVLQDIYSTLYISNLVAFICDDADELIIAKTADKGNLYEQKANRAVCISALRKRFVRIFFTDNRNNTDFLFERLCLDISKCVSYIGKSKPKPRDSKRIQHARKFRNRPLL